MAKSSSNRKKTLWEKEKLLVMSNFSFSHSVFKRTVLQTRKNQGLFGKGLIHYGTNLSVNEKNQFENIVGLREIADNHHFLFFTTMSLTLSFHRQILFFQPHICSLQNAFDFHKSTFLYVGKGLTLHHTIPPPPTPPPPSFNDLKEEGCGKHCGKRRRCWHFLLFLQCFLLDH